MHALGAYAPGIVAVLLAAVLGTVGWWYRQHRGDLAALRTHFDERIDTIERAVQTLTTAQAVIVPQFQTFGTDMDHITTRQQTLSESTAVLAATVEQHQRWIEERNRDAYQRAGRAKR